MAVYSDEHGEAWVHWYPGYGFHFDQLTQPTQQGACDLQGIDILGTSDIVAKARYPFQSVLNAGVDSKETVHKEVVNGYNKALYFEPKKGSFGHRVTAWATDINGQRLRHKEVVCFWTNDGKLDKVDGRGWYAPSGELCVRMKYAGNGGYLYLGVYDKPDASIAQVDLVGADPGAKVIATFKREKIKRMIVVGGKTDTGGATPPDGGKPTGSQTGPGTTAPTAAALKAAGIPQTQTRALRTAKAKFKKVRAHGKLKRGIVFAKFVSPTKRVKAKVQFMGFRNGNLTVLKTMKVIKKANTKKMIRIKVINKKFAKKVKSVRVVPIKAIGRPFAA